ncbi:hypothetical protein SAMN05444395_101508 [Flavobacterium fryxellicola]|nr:hypothetical protein SAMN05444395_101508 [Flavobacterium fryxellicola]
MLCIFERVTVQLNYSLKIGQLILESNRHLKVTSYSKHSNFLEAKTRVVICIVQIVVNGIHGIPSCNSVNSEI